MSRSDERRRIARTALERGNALFHGPRWRESRAEYEMARRLYTRLGDTGGLADATSNLASVAWRLSELNLADQLYGHARDLYVEIDAWWHVAKIEQYLGNVAYDRGDLHRARWFYDRARLALGSGPHPVDVADVDVNLAAVLSELGEHRRALDLLDEAEQLYRGELDGDEVTVKLSEVDQNRGSTHLSHGDLLRAWRHLSRAVRVRRHLDDPEKVADLLHNLANVAARMRRPRTARTLYEQAIARYAAFGDDRSETADCQLGLGALLWREGQPDRARPHLRAAATAYASTAEWLALARATHNLALTYPDSSADRTAAVVAPWLAMQSITWGSAGGRRPYGLAGDALHRHGGRPRIGPGR